MQNLWNDTDAAKHQAGQGSSTAQSDLGEITYGSRLIGSEPSLVLHGGGNTSIKSTSKDTHGEAVELLYVKGSGWDLATIEPPGFAPLRLEPVRRLAELPALSDTEMVNQLRLNLMDSAAPNPSVEAILHACLPHKSVLHTHADAVLALTNTTDGYKHVDNVWGDRVVVIPYVMPGFDLALVCAEQFAAKSHPGTEAMVLMNHGIFTFGETTRTAYDMMISLITEAEEYLAQHSLADSQTDNDSAANPAADSAAVGELTGAQALAMAQLRTEISTAANRPLLLSRTTGSAGTKALAFCQRDDVESLATRGPATPDHIIRTKQFPLVLAQDSEAQANEAQANAVAGFVAGYKKYFDRNLKRRANGPDSSDGPDDSQASAHSDSHNSAQASLTMLDPAPRVVLDPELGLLCAGKSITDCQIASDIYQHTIDVIEAAETLDKYVALDESHLFDVEYWELEQAKLRLGASANTGGSSLVGQVALVTGAASGIGRATAEALASRGAAVVGLDVDPKITATLAHNSWLGLTADATDSAAVETALRSAVQSFGGIDIVVVAAGIFGPAAAVGELDLDQWERTLDINLKSVANTLKHTHRYLRLSPAGGRVVLVGSKNVSAPGTAASAYSASKAGLTQLGRVAALEWAADNITVNTVHPDAVFDTGLWDDELIEQRASSYGMTAQQYKKRNLLGREITAGGVAQVIVELCGPAFRATTGAQIPIDGGSDRVI